MTMSREEFQSFLVSGFNNVIYPDNFTMYQIILTNDKTLGDTYRTNYVRAQNNIAAYLAAYDAAPDDPSKDAVVNSATFDLGTDSVDPADALLWPGSGGLFGDVKSPGTAVTDSSSVEFDGTTGQLIKQGA